MFFSELFRLRERGLTLLSGTQIIHMNVNPKFLRGIFTVYICFNLQENLLLFLFLNSKVCTNVKLILGMLGSLKARSRKNLKLLFKLICFNKNAAFQNIGFRAFFLAFVFARTRPYCDDLEWDPVYILLFSLKSMF